MEDSHQSQSLSSTEHGDRVTVPDANSGGGAGSSSAKYKLFSPAKLPISRSPCITIPPGFSPTAFLESPVLLSNIKAEPSPTTGSFWNAQVMNSGGVSGFSFSVDCSNSNSDHGRQTNFFEFRPHAVVGSVSGSPSVTPMISTGLNNQKSQSSEQAQVQPFPSRAIIPAGVDSDENQGAPLSNGIQRSQLDSKDNLFPASNERSADDGYNWRKYGQKLVKGSEFPRSYYKCTHPNCEVKKIFERSPEGQMTEIVYKGTHDHPKPQPARRYNPGAIMSSQANTTLLLTTQEGIGQMCSNMEPNGTCELSPLETNDDITDCIPSPVNGTNDEEEEEDDQLVKRRKLEGISLDVIPIVKPIREPRVVVQTVSEVDILDDGYRWRKYGQKVVRGNPNPRSYYKCTSVGCPVRKHVERASHDPRAVITTYEGKHDHDLPAAKNAAAAAANDMMSGPPNARSGSVSLDLGVGIRSNQSQQQQQQILDSRPLHNNNNNPNSIFRVVQLTPTHYGAYSSSSNSNPHPCPQTFLEEYS